MYELLTATSELLKQTRTRMKELFDVVSEVGSYPEGQERAVFCRMRLVPAMERLRKPVDELELLVDKEMWPMPSYGDIIFEV